GRLNLNIVNKETGKALANTNVTINGSKFQTNAEGQVEGLSLVTQKQTLTIEAPGYQKGEISVQTIANKTITETIKLTPNKETQPEQAQGRLNLNIVNKETGKELANTNVTINGSKFQTNAEGQVEGLSLVTQKQTLTVGAQGFQNQEISVQTIVNQTITETVQLTASK
ncbi:MAG: hypothetical protein ACRDD2_09445, partial [Sarcina sp.]